LKPDLLIVIDVQDTFRCITIFISWHELPTCVHKITRPSLSRLHKLSAIPITFHTLLLSIPMRQLKPSIATWSICGHQPTDLLENVNSHCDFEIGVRGLEVVKQVYTLIRTQYCQTMW